MTVLAGQAWTPNGMGEAYSEQDTILQQIIRVHLHNGWQFSLAPRVESVLISSLLGLIPCLVLKSANVI